MQRLCRTPALFLQIGEVGGVGRRLVGVLDRGLLSVLQAVKRLRGNASPPPCYASARDRSRWCSRACRPPCKSMPTGLGPSPTSHRRASSWTAARAIASAAASRSRAHTAEPSGIDGYQASLPRRRDRSRPLRGDSDYPKKRPFPLPNGSQGPVATIRRRLMRHRGAFGSDGMTVGRVGQGRGIGGKPSSMNGLAWPDGRARRDASVRRRVAQIRQQQRQVLRGAKYSQDPRRVGVIGVDDQGAVSRDRPEPVARPRECEPAGSDGRIATDQQRRLADRGLQPTPRRRVVQAADGCRSSACAGRVRTAGPRTPRRGRVPR